MYNQLFRRLPTNSELNKILKCYNIEDIYGNYNITYLSLKVYDTINKLYNILDLLLDIYLPCKYTFLNNLNIKRCLTILRQLLRVFDYKLHKYQIGKMFIYKIESPDINKMKIEKNKEIIF